MTQSKTYYVRVWGKQPGLFTELEGSKGEGANFSDLWKFDNYEEAEKAIEKFFDEHSKRGNPFRIFCEGPLTSRPDRWNQENLIYD